MEGSRNITGALVSVYSKEGLEPIIRKLDELGVEIYSTGGTYDFIQSLGIKAITVESVTSYPSIFGGRVKTLHPKVFGGILYRRDNAGDKSQAAEYEIPKIDLVVVDLYPFEKTLETTHDEAEIIEKIDIGGISLIRAAAKNYESVAIVPSVQQYGYLLSLLHNQGATTTLEQRRYLAAEAFNTSSHYDTRIFEYFNKQAAIPVFKQSIQQAQTLRYGENPHQKASFYGDLSQMFTQLHGKELSYNNLLDLDAAISLIDEFEEPTFGILKHNNACGVASRSNLLAAWKDALAGDPISAYGGVLVCNRVVDEATAHEVNKLFFELIIAPGFENNSLQILESKKNRIILQRNSTRLPSQQFRTILNGVAFQERDLRTETANAMQVVTGTVPSDTLLDDLAFGNIIVKHTKSNAIVLVKGKQLLGSGTGQTSRVDAVRQAIDKANAFGFDLSGAIMASDAFFPFADSVQLAKEAGITAVIQPGGSVRDNDTIDFCNANKLVMVLTGTRHFKH
jgi:phosphoribosylaminoimidazolecarboxamide formyltransferase/IMP cyclohydrolase